MYLVFSADSGEEVTVTFDATLSEAHDDSVLVTERAVESGAPVTDHIRPEPARLRVEAHITNTPIRDTIASHMDGASLSFHGTELEVNVFSGPFARVGPIGIGGGAATVSVHAVVLTASQEFDRVRAVYEALLALQRTGTLVRCVTSLREYENMAMRNLSAPRTADDGSGITTTFDLQQIRIANPEIVDAPEPSEPRGRPTMSRGRQEAVEQATQPPNQSAAVRLGILGGVLSP